MELVVAVSLIALLSALLVPVLQGYGGRSHCRSGSRRSACLSNVRQIGLAFKQYAVDNGDAFPTSGAPAAIAKSSYVFAMLTNGNYLAIGKIYLCPSDTGKTTGAPASFGPANNSYGCVVGDVSGRAAITEGVSSDNPLVFDQAIVGAPNWVHNLSNAKWFTNSPHRDGGNVVYVGGQAAFKKSFDLGSDGTNGYVIVP